MSVQALAWAWEQETGSPTAKAVLLALADHADQDGICWPGIERIARKTELSRRTVIRQLTALADDAFLEVSPRSDKDGKQTSNLYRIALDRDPGSGMTERHGGDDRAASPGVTESPIRGERAAPDPSVNRQEEPSKEPSAREVDQIPISDQEYELARRLLAAFNIENGSGYPLDGQMDKIVRAIRRRPDLSEQDHLGIIAKAMRDPWWKGQPSPAVIWGKPDLFDAHVEAWRSKDSRSSSSRFSKYDEGTIAA